MDFDPGVVSERCSLRCTGLGIGFAFDVAACCQARQRVEVGHTLIPGDIAKKLRSKEPNAGEAQEAKRQQETLQELGQAPIRGNSRRCAMRWRAFRFLIRYEAQPA